MYDLWLLLLTEAPTMLDNAALPFFFLLDVVEVVLRPRQKQRKYLVTLG